MTIPMERRAGRDRRCHDGGPPSGWCERRRSVERRQPEVGLTDISDSDWEKYFGNGMGTLAPAVIHEGEQFEVAAVVFDRVRD